MAAIFGDGAQSFTAFPGYPVSHTTNGVGTLGPGTYLGTLPRAGHAPAPLSKLNVRRYPTLKAAVAVSQAAHRRAPAPRPKLSAHQLHVAHLAHVRAASIGHVTSHRTTVPKTTPVNVGPSHGTAGASTPVAKAQPAGYGLGLNLSPGMEAIIIGVGLFAVAVLVLKRRKRR